MPRALIVEDEPEANKLLAMLVQLRGYETSSALTGGDALEQVRQSPPDLVFLDLMLPDITGYDVCRNLKSRRGTIGIPVVMVTARLAQENRLDGFLRGATDYVPKPYTPDQIFAAMARADDWRSKLASTSLEGSIPLDTRHDVAHLRQISWLHAWILRNTSLSESDTLAINLILLEIATLAMDWGGRTGADLVATLDYRIDQNSLILSFRDQSGWFPASPSFRSDQLSVLVARGRFDQVVSNERHSEVTFHRLFSPQS